MKSIKVIFALIFFFNLSAQAQSFKTETFRVYGNCGMCEKKIERAALDTKGVAKADWDVDTDMLTVVYKPKKVELNDIKKAIAAVGYDSDDFRADDAVYENLHHCCQYERPPAKQ